MRVSEEQLKVIISRRADAYARRKRVGDPKLKLDQHTADDLLLDLRDASAAMRLAVAAMERESKQFDWEDSCHQRCSCCGGDSPNHDADCEYSAALAACRKEVGE